MTQAFTKRTHSRLLFPTIHPPSHCSLPTQAMSFGQRIINIERAEIQNFGENKSKLENEYQTRLKYKPGDNASNKKTTKQGKYDANKDKDKK